MNKAVNPLFVGLGDYHLQAVSPCRDSGNPDPSYNDPAHPCRPSLAKPPALAGLRNDMGAYGGAGADDWYDMKLLVTPEALDFGEIPVEEESTMNITVANLGIYTGFDLEICSVISSEPEFEIDLMDTLVEAEDEEYVDVTFEAADTGWVSGTITVWTADGSRVLPVQARGVIPVAVAGAGLPPIPFRLEPNAPNPFNPYTSLRFSLPEPAEVLLRVHDVAGRAVATLARGAYDAGEFQAVWNGRSDGGRGVPPGIYFAHLTAGEKKAVRKMLLVK